VTEYPHKRNLREILTDWADDLKNAEGARIAGRSPVGQVMQRATEELRSLRAFNEPSGLYARLPMNFVIH
jgi:hypothetical protein